MKIIPHPQDERFNIIKMTTVPKTLYKFSPNQNNKDILQEVRTNSTKTLMESEQPKKF